MVNNSLFDYEGNDTDIDSSLIEPDTNDDLSWFSNFAQALDLNFEHCEEKSKKPPNLLSEQKPSLRWHKLNRVTAGEQTHIKKDIANDSVDAHSAKSALTLYLEEKNAMYEENVAKALARRNPPLEAEDLHLKEHWKQIADVKAAIRLRWISEQAKLQLDVHGISYIKKYKSKV
jgi:hypothetical protein